MSSPPALAVPLWTLVAAAAWAAAVPYLAGVLGVELAVDATVEVVDHLLPGLITIGLALIARRSTGALRDAGLAGCVLAGIWILVSHLTLWRDGGSEGRPWDAVLLHGTAGVPLLVLAAAALLLPPSRDAA